MTAPPTVQDEQLSKHHNSLIRDRPFLHSYVTTLIIIATFLFEIGDLMMKAPYFRILENTVCQHYWDSQDPTRFPPSSPIPEKWCKIAPVQNTVSMIVGWDQLFFCIPSLLLTIPLGILADTRGRRTILTTSLIGICLMVLTSNTILYFPSVFDPRWTWASNIFTFIGGGVAVANSMLMIILADITSEDDRATAFFRVMAASLSATIVAVPTAWYLMRITPWLPMWLAFGFLVLGTMVTLLVPETLDSAASLSNDASDRVGELEGLLDNTSPSPDNNRPSLDSKNQPHGVKAYITSLPSKLSFIFSSKTLIFLAATFTLTSLSKNALTVLLQLASTRFVIPLASASLILPISSAVNFVLLAFALPYISHLLTTHYALTPPAKDLAVARYSVLFIVLGLLGIGIAPNLAVLIVAVGVQAGGVGYFGANRALITEFVKRDEVGRLYSVLGILDMVGRLVAGPVLSKLFRCGMSLGGLWNGLPFLFAAACFALGGCVVWAIRVPG